MDTAGNSLELRDRALEQAAKFICNLKCGLCPMREKDFQGCPFDCHEDLKPWMCWKAYFERLACADGSGNPRVSS